MTQHLCPPYLPLDSYIRSSRWVYFRDSSATLRKMARRGRGGATSIGSPLERVKGWAFEGYAVQISGAEERDAEAKSVQPAIEVRSEHLQCGIHSHWCTRIVVVGVSNGDLRFRSKVRME